MEMWSYRRYVDEMTELIQLGRSLDVDISDAERIFRISLKHIANGDDLKGIQAAKSAKAMVHEPIRLALEDQLEQIISDIKVASMDGCVTDRPSKYAQSSREYLKESNLKDAARDNQLAIDALAKAQTQHASIIDQLEFTGWMLDVLAVFDTVPSHMNDTHEESLRVLSDGQHKKAMRLERIVRDVMEERLWCFMDELLDRAQKCIVNMRERETDPARISLEYRSAAEYLEMARRRYDRGTADDMTVTLEYLHVIETRYCGET